MKTYNDQLSEYVNFENKEQLKKSFNLFRRVFKFELTQSENKVLFTMVGYAVKYPGACKMKLETIAAKAGVSLSSVRRAISKGEDLGIIKRFKTRKEKGRRRGATVYQFQKFESELQDEHKDEHKTMNTRQNNEKPCESKREGIKLILKLPFLLTPSLSFKDTNITEKYPEKSKAEKMAIKKKAVLEKIPNALHGLAFYSDDSDVIYKLAGVIFKAKAERGKNVKIEEHEDLFRKKIRSVYEYWKRQERKGIEDHNIFGLLRKAIRELVTDIVNGTAYETKKAPVRVQGRKSEDLSSFDPRHNPEDSSKVQEVSTSDKEYFEAERLKILAKLGA